MATKVALATTLELYMYVDCLQLSNSSDRHLVIFFLGYLASTLLSEWHHQVCGYTTPTFIINFMMLLTWFWLPGSPVFLRATLKNWEEPGDETTHAMCTHNLNTQWYTFACTHNPTQWYMCICTNNPNTVYAKTYHLMSKRKWNHFMYDYARACFYYVTLCNDLVHIHITVCVLYLWQNELFLFFSGSYLKAPEAVPFHTTTIHCH